MAFSRSENKRVTSTASTCATRSLRHLPESVCRLTGGLASPASSSPPDARRSGGRVTGGSREAVWADTKRGDALSVRKYFHTEKAPSRVCFVSPGPTCPGSPAGVCRACSQRAASAPRGCALGPAGSPDEGDRKRASDAAKLPLQVVQREQERGGAAVREVVRLVGKAALADQGGDLLGRETVASPHRRSRLPAARRLTVETSGVVLGPSRGSVFRCWCASC